MKTMKIIALYIMLSASYAQCSLSSRKAGKASSNNQIDCDRMNQNLQKRCDETGHDYIDYATKQDTVTYYINGQKVTRHEFDNCNTRNNANSLNTSTQLQPPTATPIENQSPESKPRSFNDWMARKIAENEQRFKDNHDNSDSDSDDDNS